MITILSNIKTINLLTVYIPTINLEIQNSVKTLENHTSVLYLNIKNKNVFVEEVLRKFSFFQYIVLCYFYGLL